MIDRLRQELTNRNPVAPHEQFALGLERFHEGGQGAGSSSTIYSMR